ncbi:MAG TPA: hypothetical protein VFQ44_07600 [Streptosporangiaceae bacterium]|nr:hypothetical protein [Streptosporangiaceae bacterium]
MTTNKALDIAMLPASVCAGSQLTALLNLINDVYAVAEEGLWVPGATRTTMAR